jgi:hypothetical protein
VTTPGTRQPQRHEPRAPRGVEWPFLVVVVVASLGLLVIALLDRFRRGSVVFGGAFVLAAVLRLVLPTRTAGLLAVRSRVFDVLAFAAVGIAIAVVAVVTPAAAPGG